MKFKATLSIGYPTATHEAVIEIEDELLEGCENDDELREELIQSYWQEWAWNYIESSMDPID